MNRGEIWTVSGGDYAGKPRPAVILQADAFGHTGSVTICPLTSDIEVIAIFRILVATNHRNGLTQPSVLMADKISTISKTKIGKMIGMLDDEDMLRLERAVMIFLGLA